MELKKVLKITDLLKNRIDTVRINLYFDPNVWVAEEIQIMIIILEKQT